MLTLNEFSKLAREIKNADLFYSDERIFPGGQTGEIELMELLLEYTDLSTEDNEYLKELDEEIFGKLKTE